MIQYIGVRRFRMWRRLGGNTRVAAPGALAPQIVLMGWAKYSRKRRPETPVTNTSTIL
jgi:hypothetical protein